MKRELDELLCSRYPEIFRDRHADMRTTAMCWGFDCGDGWFDIIDGLCHQITELVRSGKSASVVAVQVKEKYGTLRFNVFAANDEVLELIDEAEAKSERTCESCGQPGLLIPEGWYRVRCDACEGENVCEKVEELRKVREEFERREDMRE